MKIDARLERRRRALGVFDKGLAIPPSPTGALFLALGFIQGWVWEQIITLIQV